MNPTYLIIKSRDKLDDTSKQFTIPNPTQNPTPAQATAFLNAYNEVYGTMHGLVEMYKEERIRTVIYPEP